MTLLRIIPPVHVIPYVRWLTNVYYITPFADLTHVRIHLLKYGVHMVLNCHGEVEHSFQTILKIQQNWS